MAWVDPPAATPRLLVYDVVTGTRHHRAGPAAERTGPDASPTATGRDRLAARLLHDGRRLGRSGRAGPAGPPDETGASDLVDVASASRLFQLDAAIDLARPAVLQHRVPDVRGPRAASSSADGNFACTRSPDDGSVLVYDTRSGEPVAVSAAEPVDGVIDAVLDAAVRDHLPRRIDPDGFAQLEGSDSNAGQRPSSSPASSTRRRVQALV